MPSFIFEPIKNNLKKDRFYRLICTRDLQKNTSVAEKDLLISSVTVVFSEFDEAHQEIDSIVKMPAYNYFSPEIVNEEQKEIVLNCTDLRVFTSGSVWLNGEKVWSPTRTMRVTINQKGFQTSSFSRQNLNYKILKSYIPKILCFEECKVGVEVMNVYIPTMEVIRYFYARSAKQINELFNYGFSDAEGSNVFLEWNHKETERSLWVKINRDYTDKDIYLLARTLLDESFKNNINLVRSSIVQEKNYPFISPKAQLPFSGLKHIDVQGIKLKNNRENVQCFLIMRIKSADYAYPFDSLEILAPESYSINPEAISDPKSPGAPAGNGGSKPGSTGQGRRPDAQIERVSVAFDDEDDDPALDRLNVFKEKRVSDGETRGSGYNPMPSISDDEIDQNKPGSSLPGNFKESSNETPITQEQIDRQKSEKNGKRLPPNQRLNQVLKIIDSLGKSFKDLKICFLPVGNVDSQGFYRFEQSGNARTWFYSNKKLGLNRRALFLELTWNSKSLYILEIESNGSDKFALYYLEEPREEFKSEDFLQDIVVNGSTNLRSKVFDIYFSSSKFDKTPHTTGEGSGFFENVTDKVILKLGLPESV